MTRIVLIGCLLVLGCNRGGPGQPPVPPSMQPGKGPNDNLTGAQRVQQSKILPAPGRAVWYNDLDNLRKYITQYQIESNRYPTKLDEMPDVARDLPRIATAIREGELILAGGKGGVLAYEKDAETVGGRVMTTSGIQNMTASELNTLLK